MTTSSGTNWPLSIKLFASNPSGVRLAISSRSKLPVDKWISLYFSTSFSDWVPFPLPGGPNRIRLNITANTRWVKNKYNVHRVILTQIHGLLRAHFQAARKSYKMLRNED